MSHLLPGLFRFGMMPNELVCDLIAFGSTGPTILPSRSSETTFGCSLADATLLPLFSGSRSGYMVHVFHLLLI